jgi:hypothetical protein
VLEEGRRAWPEDARLGRDVGLAYAVAGERDAALAALRPYVDAHPEDTRTLFVALRLSFDAEVHAAPADPSGRERLARYARAYLQADGPQRELVARWLRYAEAKP